MLKIVWTRVVRAIDRPVNIQLIRQGTRASDTFFLVRSTDDHVAQSGMESNRVPPGEFGGRRQIAVGAGQVAAALIRVLKVKGRR